MDVILRWMFNGNTMEIMGLKDILIPTCSMYGIFTYIWVIFRANVGTYSIHGAYETGLT